VRAREPVGERRGKDVQERERAKETALIRARLGPTGRSLDIKK
jgi:hypothetical protein